MGLSTTMAALGENEEEITAEEQRRIKKVEGGAEAVVRGYRKRVGHAHGVCNSSFPSFPFPFSFTFHSSSLSSPLPSYNRVGVVCSLCDWRARVFFEG